jgi:hypothetical protein
VGGAGGGGGAAPGPPPGTGQLAGLIAESTK